MPIGCHSGYKTLQAQKPVYHLPVLSLVRQAMLPAGLLLAFAVLPFSTPAHAVSSKVLDVSFPDPPTGERNLVSDNLLGISWELYVVNYLWGETPDTMPNAMKNYLSNIRARMSNPLRIRMGGNSMDGSQYVASQQNMITLTDPDAYYNDVPCDFGPMLFDVLNAMSDTVGEMQFILGLSMRDPDQYDNIIELTAASRDKFGGRLDSLLLGNEPDLYAGHGERGEYTIDMYITELNQIFNEMENSVYGNLTNVTLMGGPTVCCSWDLSDVLSAGMTNLSYKYYTIQHYPTHVCSGQTDKSSNISYFVSHPNIPPFVQWNDEGIVIAKQEDVPVLLTEYNSISCGGDPNVSPTFSTTLWAVDVALQAASGNFTGVYLHTRELGVTYNLFEPPSEEEYLSSDWKTGAIYYATLVVAETISSNSSVVVDLNLDNSMTSYDASVAGYAIYDGPDLTKSKFVLFNYDYPRANTDESDATSNTTQTFVLPGNLSDSIGVRYLIADNITEQTAISWAGQTVGVNGALQGVQLMDVFNCSNGCNVTVPGPGLVVVWLDPESDLQRTNIYVGNSTIADVYTGPLETSAAAMQVLHDSRCHGSALTRSYPEDMEITFGGKYKIEEEIGFGGCGSVYMGTHTIAGKEVAIKVESANAKRSMLMQESRIYKTLMGGPGVPWMMWSGKQGDYNVLVLDLLGPSLEDLHKICNKQFSLKTVLLLADQMLSLIEFIHSRDWVHRDIKPANFLMGPDVYSSSRPSSCDRVNVIDFGLAKKYANSGTGKHIKNTQCDTHGVGTPLFASINTHRGEDCSRRDDLESLAYTLIYFLCGTLPWRKVKPPPEADKNPKIGWDKVLVVKLAAEESGAITAGLPTEFDIFYRYVRSLAFEDLPDYVGCRKLFRDLAKREGIEYDGQFDWTVVGDRVWNRSAKKRSVSGPSSMGGGSQRRRRFCEACEARAAMEAEMNSIPLSRR
ncbi:hypothetical protein A7U60_g4402 [Sanghuangporus baumii]|uniref:Protein kinase domain-containing protein n=1 Tax=Sanghuangporus baumii TaxID=108892 RepID=A0A9Q5HYU5_SANBA|nr:hypothetical protein A7U60_g4402 [Sanghuangporus baumii]